MKNLAFTSLVAIGIALCIPSCIDSNLKGNMVVTGYNPAVVNRNINTGTLTLLSSYFDAEIFIPAEIAAELQEGQCLMANLTMNWDNQPNSNYYTAEMVSYETVRQNPVYFTDSIRMGEYTAPIEGVSWAYRPILKGKYFFQIEYKGEENRSVDYCLYTSSDSIDATGAANLYLFSKREKTTGSTLNQIHAFDLNPVLQAFGRDTTIQNTSLRYAKFNINYLQKEENEAPVFGRANDEPIEIFIYK